VGFPGKYDDCCGPIWFGNAERVAFPVDDKHADPGTA
jgi:hypothetical protein